jgi:hypothetical protein
MVLAVMLLPSDVMRMPPDARPALLLAAAPRCRLDKFVMLLARLPAGCSIPSLLPCLVYLQA